MLIFGVLQIILFFKIWGMTNDVREIRDFIVNYENVQTMNAPTNEKPPYEQDDCNENPDSRIENLGVGDEVILKSSGQRATITKDWGSYFIVRKPDGKVCVNKKDVSFID